MQRLVLQREARARIVATFFERPLELRHGVEYADLNWREWQDIRQAEGALQSVVTLRDVGVARYPQAPPS